MDVRFDGKVAVVTGASEGIGYATAERFGLDGASVAVCGRSESKLAAAATKLEQQGINVYSKPTDVADPLQFETFMDGAAAAFGGIDILINNAGIAQGASIADMSIEDWDKVLDTNLRSTFVGGKLALKYMKDSGGVIANASSFATIIPSVGTAAYAASKAAIASLTRVMASEFAPFGIRVFGYIPGFIDTPMNAPNKAAQPEKMLAPIALRRYGESEDIANVIVFMCSPWASYVTGNCVEISGGKFATQYPEFAWK